MRKLNAMLTPLVAAHADRGVFPRPEERAFRIGVLRKPHHTEKPLGCVAAGRLASFVLRLIGEAGKARQLEFQFQSNTRRSRPVLSVISLALQLVQHGMAAFPPREFRETLERLRYDHPALQLCGETSESDPIDLVLYDNRTDCVLQNRTDQKLATMTV